MQLQISDINIPIEDTLTRQIDTLKKSAHAGSHKLLIVRQKNNIFSPQINQ